MGSRFSGSFFCALPIVWNDVPEMVSSDNQQIADQLLPDFFWFSAYIIPVFFRAIIQCRKRISARVVVCYTLHCLCCDENVTVFLKKKFAQFFDGYQWVALEKYHKNITFISQAFLCFSRPAIICIYLILITVSTSFWLTSGYYPKTSAYRQINPG